MNSSSITTDNSSEPKAALVAVPVIIFVVLAILFYAGALYVDSHGGGFNPAVYTPYVSTKQLDSFKPKTAGGEQMAKGKQLYATMCAVCHQESGIGGVSQGCPTLVGSEWVLGAPDNLVKIISKGLTGPITVKGQTYSTGSMPAIGDGLPGDEKAKAEAVAAIATYVRGTWGNKAPAVKPADAQKIREGIKDRSQSFTAEELQQAQ